MRGQLHLLENIVLVTVLAFSKVFLTGDQDFHRCNMVFWGVSMCGSWTITWGYAITQWCGFHNAFWKRLLVFLPLSSFRLTITARVVLWRRNSHGPFRISTFSEFQDRSFLWLRPSSRIGIFTISTYTAMFCQFNSTWLSMPWAWQWDYDQDGALRTPNHCMWKKAEEATWWSDMVAWIPDGEAEHWEFTGEIFKTNLKSCDLNGQFCRMKSDCPQLTLCIF